MVSDLEDDFDEFDLTDSAADFLSDQFRKCTHDEYNPTPRQVAWIASLYNRHVDRGGLGEQILYELDKRGILPSSYQSEIGR